MEEARWLLNRGLNARLRLRPRLCFKCFIGVVLAEESDSELFGLSPLCWVIMHDQMYVKTLKINLFYYEIMTVTRRTTIFRQETNFKKTVFLIAHTLIIGWSGELCCITFSDLALLLLPTAVSVQIRALKYLNLHEW